MNLFGFSEIFQLAQGDLQVSTDPSLESRTSEAVHSGSSKVENTVSKRLLRLSN
mgnify:CR=1 FL=1